MNRNLILSDLHNKKMTGFLNGLKRTNQSYLNGFVYFIKISLDFCVISLSILVPDAVFRISYLRILTFAPRFYSFNKHQ